MTKKRKQIIGLIFVILGIAGLVLVLQGFFLPEIQAGAGDNISGWIWSSNIGWISLNSINCDSDDNGFSDGVPAGCPVFGTEIDSYGVNIDTSTGIFSGKAWSENIGKISFNQADLVGCPSGTCQAEMNLTNGEVSGWIRATSPIGDPEAGGWDGWIKLRGTESGTGTEYGVNYDTSGASPSLVGWAWGGDDNGSGSAVVGWVSFNDNNLDDDDDDDIDDPPPVCPDCDPPGTPIEDYDPVIPLGLINAPPSATLDVVTPQTYCTAPKEAFSWDFNDEDPLQTSYHLQVKKQSSPAWGSWTVGNGEYDSTKIDSSTENVLISITTGSTIGQLDYKEIYEWRLMVWDSGGLDSGWTYGTNFSTEDHMYPTVTISPTPVRVSIDEWVQMNDTSECYTTGGGSYDCYTDLFGSISYQWDYSYENPPGLQIDSTYERSASGETNASTTYASYGTYLIKLRVIDNSIPGSASCDSDAETIYVGPHLPDWREVAP